MVNPVVARWAVSGHEKQDSRGHGVPAGRHESAQACLVPSGALSAGTGPVVSMSMPSPDFSRNGDVAGC